MGMFWNSPPAAKPCSHQWDVIEKITYPSNVEQIGLDKKPPEEVQKWLRKIQPSDFMKRTFIVMKCPFCGEIKEFKDEPSQTRSVECNHDWEIIKEVVYPSVVEQLKIESLPMEERARLFRGLG